MFDKYCDNQEFSLKEQERINGVINGTVSAYMEENAQVMPQGKAYQQYLENTKNTPAQPRTLKTEKKCCI